MDIQEALELLKQYQGEIAHLKTLRYSDNQRWLWKSKVDVVLEAAFGKDSEEYRWLNPNFFFAIGGLTDAREQQDYLRTLEEYKLGIEKILQKYEILGIPVPSHAVKSPEEKGVVKEIKETLEPPNAFIAHGGETLALDKLQEFLDALGVIPIIAEKQPSENRSIDEQVSWCLGKCDCAVILANKGDIDSGTKEFIPRGNVLIEVGRCQERFPSKTIYLLEEGATFPSNISEKVWEHFTQDNMEKAFIKIAKELRAFGIIKATKP
jgi:predicted nucleotide-binding protein